MWERSSSRQRHYVFPARPGAIYEWTSEATGASGDTPGVVIVATVGHVDLYTGETSWAFEAEVTRSIDSMRATEAGEFVAFSFGRLITARNKETGDAAWERRFDEPARLVATEMDLLIAYVDDELHHLSIRDGSTIATTPVSSTPVRAYDCGNSICIVSADADGVQTTPNPGIHFAFSRWEELSDDSSFAKISTRGEVTTDFRGRMFRISGPEGTRIYDMLDGTPVSEPSGSANSPLLVDDERIAYAATVSSRLGPSIRVTLSTIGTTVEDVMFLPFATTLDELLPVGESLAVMRADQRKLFRVNLDSQTVIATAAMPSLPADLCSIEADNDEQVVISCRNGANVTLLALTWRYY